MWKSALALILVASLLSLPIGARAGDDEAAVLASTAGAVEQDGDHFVIHLKSGKIKLYGCPPKTDCSAVWLDAYDRAGRVFVFHLSDGDIDEYSLVDDRTGATTYLDRAPSFSPTGDVAVELVYGENIASFNQRPAINIWRRSGGKFKREWSRPIVAEGDYTVVGWLSNDRVDIKAVIPTGWTGRERITAGRGTKIISVIRKAKGWRVVSKKVVPEWE